MNQQYAMGINVNHMMRAGVPMEMVMMPAPPPPPSIQPPDPTKVTPVTPQEVIEKMRARYDTRYSKIATNFLLYRPSQVY